MAVPLNVIFLWVGTHASIPAGWTRETTLDSKYVIGAPAATNPGTLGGSATHNHTVTDHTHTQNSHLHTFSGGTASTVAIISELGGTIAASETHTHASKNSNSATAVNQNATVTLNTASNDPPYFDVIYLKSAGTNDIANDMVAFFNSATPPTGWDHCNGTGTPDLRNRFLRGAAAAGNGGGTGGSSDAHTHTETAAHNHTQNAHTHSAITSTGPTGLGGTNTIPSLSASRSNHTHSTSLDTQTATNNTASVTFQNGDAQPVWKKLLPIQNNTGADSFPNGVIGLWLGTLAAIPTDWKLCDGTLSTPDMRDSFAQGANTTAEIGNTGGATTHTHVANAHTHTQVTHNHAAIAAIGNTTITVDPLSVTPSNLADPNHTHTWTIGNTVAVNQNTTVTVQSTASKAHYPAYVETAFIQWQDPAAGAGSQIIYRRLRVR